MGAEILAVVGVVAVVGFIGYRVWVAKNKTPSSGGGANWKDDKYPNQDKK